MLLTRQGVRQWHSSSLGVSGTVQHWLLLAGRLLWNAVQLLLLTAWLFVTSVPAQSLPFAEYVELSHRPLRFVLDPTLSGVSLAGITAFPGERTFGAWLLSPATHLPRASLLLQEGMAVRVLATAYSSTVDQTDADPFTTASGAHVSRGTLAANFLPLGTKVRIGRSLYTVEDRLNGRFNNTYIVDVWQPDRASARAFGVRVTDLEIVSLP